LSINKNTKSTNFEGGPNYGGRSKNQLGILLKVFIYPHQRLDTWMYLLMASIYHYGDVYFAWPSLAWNGSDSLHSQYQMGYELKSDCGWQDLIDLIYTLNFQIEDIETILNVDRALWFFAVDAYTGLYRHNYYLYRNTSSGQFEVIPWDKDQTLAIQLSILFLKRAVIFNGSIVTPPFNMRAITLDHYLADS